MIEIAEDTNTRKSLELSHEEDPYELLVIQNDSPPSIPTKKLKKLSKKGWDYLPLLVDKKARRKKKLQKLISMHQMDAAEERRKRLLKINKKLGYPSLHNSNPVVVRTKQKFYNNEQNQIVLRAERTVVPCQFYLKDKDSEKLEIEPEKFEFLWLELLGHGIFCLFETIKDEAIISEAKLFFHTMELIAQEENSVTLRLAILPLSQVVSAFTHGKLDLRNNKKNKSWESSDAVIQFVEPKIKEHWMTIFFPLRFSVDIITGSGQYEIPDDDEQDLYDSNISGGRSRSLTA